MVNLLKVVDIDFRGVQFGAASTFQKMEKEKNDVESSLDPNGSWERIVRGDKRFDISGLEILNRHRPKLDRCEVRVYLHFHIESILFCK